MPDFVLWAPVVSAGVSVAGAIAAVVGWVKARGERNEAARQAEAATKAAVEGEKHLKAIAQVQVERHEAATAQLADEEREPWSIDDMADSDYFKWLRNTTGLSKYGVEVSGETVDSEGPIAFIGPFKRKKIAAYRIGNYAVHVDITWHLREDRTDEPLTQRWDLG